jgi:hypothetical protein
VGDRPIAAVMIRAEQDLEVPVSDATSDEERAAAASMDAIEATLFDERDPPVGGSP